MEREAYLQFGSGAGPFRTVKAETRERVLFIAFTFVPAVVGVAAAGVYVVEAARWFRETAQRNDRGAGQIQFRGRLRLVANA